MQSEGKGGEVCKEGGKRLLTARGGGNVWPLFRESFGWGGEKGKKDGNVLFFQFRKERGVRQVVE